MRINGKSDGEKEGIITFEGKCARSTKNLGSTTGTRAPKHTCPIRFSQLHTLKCKDIRITRAHH